MFEYEYSEHMFFICKSHVLHLINEKVFNQKQYGNFFIGFFMSLPGEILFEIVGFLLMLISFYLMYLNSKQKNKEN